MLQAAHWTSTEQRVIIREFFPVLASVLRANKCDIGDIPYRFGAIRASVWRAYFGLVLYLSRVFHA